MWTGRVDLKDLASIDNREDWLLQRQTGITASDMPDVLGRGRYGGPYSVAASKLVEPSEKEDSEFIEAGRRLESFIAEWAGEEMDEQVEQSGVLYRSREYPWILSTLDYWITDGDLIVPLEIKNTRLASDWSAGVPDYVDIQVQTQMIVTESPHAYVAVLLDGNRMRWAWVERNDDLVDLIVSESRWLWGKVQAARDMGELDVPTDASDACRLALLKLYPPADDKTIELPGDLMDVDHEIVEADEKIKALEVLRDAGRNRIREAMREAVYGVLPNGTRYSYKPNKNGARSLRRLKGEEK